MTRPNIEELDRLWGEAAAKHTVPVATLTAFSRAYPELSAYIRKLEKEREWQPIATAPKDGADVLLLFSDGVRAIGSWSVAAEFWDNHYCETDEEPGDAEDGEVWIVSWRPLPEPPKETP